MRRTPFFLVLWPILMFLAAQTAPASRTPSTMLQVNSTADSGPGTLRLTASQLVFTADSGRVTVLERYDILGVAATRELPDRSLAQPALAVSTASEVLYFVVASAGDWERRLTHD